MRFDEIDFEDEVLDGLYDMNFEEMTLPLCDSGTAEERCRNRPRRLPIPAVRETRRYPPAGISRQVFHLTKQRPRGSSRTHLFRSKRPAFF